MSAQKYKYTALPANKSSIRCVRLLPTSRTGEPELVIQEHSLEAAAGKYDAISYTWGADEPSCPIRINEQLMLLRRNIWNLLKHHQQTGISSPSLGLWVDSICINQESIEEKNVQVKQMRLTFQQARRVLVWLGDASADNTLMQHYQGHEQHDTEERLDWDEFLTASISADLSNSSSHALRDALHKVLHNGYWRRLWIIQELALAQSIAIILGTSTIGVDDLASMALYRLRQLFDGLDEDLYVFRPEHSDIMVIEGLIELHRSKDTQSLSHLTLKFHEHLCKDPRDKIYGLLGLMNEEHMFHVDYGFANEEVFSQAARCLAADDPGRGVPAFSCRLLMQELRVNPASCTTFEQLRHSRGELLTELDTTINLGWRVDARHRITACESHPGNCTKHVQFELEGVLQCLERLPDRAANDAEQFCNEEAEIFECRLDSMSTSAVLRKNVLDTIALECFISTSMYPGSKTFRRAYLSHHIRCRLNRRLADHAHQIFDMFQGNHSLVLIPTSVLELVHILDQDFRVQQERVAIQQKLDAAAGIRRLADFPNTVLHS